MTKSLKLYPCVACMGFHNDVRTRIACHKWQAHWRIKQNRRLRRSREWRGW